MPNSSRRHSRGLLQPAKYASVNLLYCLSRFALRPAGGSSVIFTPSCRMLTGKEGLGMLVNHRRKSLCTCAVKVGRQLQLGRDSHSLLLKIFNPPSLLCSSRSRRNAHDTRAFH